MSLKFRREVEVESLLYIDGCGSNGSGWEYLERVGGVKKRLLILCWYKLVCGDERFVFYFYEIEDLLILL